MERREIAEGIPNHPYVRLLLGRYEYHFRGEVPTFRAKKHNRG